MGKVQVFQVKLSQVSQVLDTSHSPLERVLTEMLLISELTCCDASQICSGEKKIRLHVDKLSCGGLSFPAPDTVISNKIGILRDI